MPESLTQEEIIHRFRDRRARHKELLEELAQRRRTLAANAIRQGVKSPHGLLQKAPQNF